MDRPISIEQPEHLFYSVAAMATLSPDVSAALASLQARWSAAAPRIVGALAMTRQAAQLARLALTFGEDRVRRVAIADPEAPLPEARWTWRG
jgi:hypothetical protein